jgi:DNA-binding SARP family transcriptional activator
VTQSIDAREASHAIYRARVPVLTIRTLGGLQVLRRGTIPLSARDWQGSRPALLLKAILVHGGRHIPKDILVEAVWPDHPPENSLRNFKVNLHRLRKMLEPDLEPARGSSYIHLKDNLVSLDKHLCQVDTEALHRLCKRARRIDAGVDTRELEAMRREASALYRGDFLPEEPYLTWAEMKRTTLRQAFMQLMYDLGRRLETQQAFTGARRCYRQIIDLDPAQEKAQRHLMRLLDAAGRPREALQLYDAVRTFLHNEIGAAPDRATVELGENIRLRLAAD